MLWLLVENIFRCYMNGFRHKNAFYKFGNILAIIILFVVYISMFLFTSRYFSFLSKLNPNNLDLYLLSIFLAGILSYLLLAGISDAIYYFLLCPDLSLLLSMPIHPRILWVYKFLEIILSKSIFLSVGLAAILGLGYGSGGHFLYYPVATVFFFIFCFIPIAVGILVIWLPIRFTKPKKVYAIFRVSAGIILSIMVVMILIHLFRPDLFQKLQLEQFQSIVSSPVWNWLPSGWLANSLFSLLAGRIVSMIAYGLPLIVMSYALFHFHCFRKNRRNIFPEPARHNIGIKPTYFTKKSFFL